MDRVPEPNLRAGGGCLAARPLRCRNFRPRAVSNRDRPGVKPSSSSRSWTGAWAVGAARGNAGGAEARRRRAHEHHGRQSIKHSIGALLLAGFLTVPAQADHQSVVVYYCFEQPMQQTRIAELYVIETSTSRVLGTWGQDDFNDPEAGLDAWLEDSVGADWATHDMTFYEKVQGDCLP